ncbi:hypothetical protein [Conexibacter sp. S30A1]|uniref:hypothetical protein n=1 Tax=Conexibacter sp. S30A1 TaxID=2937800 RepID=UPI00200F0E1B|nr:hypothetical protein [Conexibacter sp. S30A1]
MSRWTRTLRACRFGVRAVLLAALIGAASTPALAAAKPGGHGGGGGTATTTGNDVSYPQCGSTLPSAPAFAIVGLTGGLANNLNPCFGPSSSYPSYTQSELYGAASSATGVTVSQPKVSLYVNTADPGNVYNGTLIGDWPQSSLTTDQYGSCLTTSVTLSSRTYTVGENSPACAWQYGFNKAAQDAAWLAAAASAINDQQPQVTVNGSAGSYPWWLDVETANTWQSNTAMNVADLQGMIAGLKAAGAATVGAYSTASQWDTVTGGTNSLSGSLYGIPEWLPGARTLSGAMAACSQTPFTGGQITLTQWFSRPFDSDFAC